MALPKLAKLIRDAKRLWKSGMAGPTRKYFLDKRGDGRKCCLVGAAYYANKNRFRAVNPETIRKFVQREYNLTDDQVNDLIYGFDRGCAPINRSEMADVAAKVSQEVFS